MLEDVLNRKIRDWWFTLPDEFRKNMPTFIHKPKTDADLLFVGLNPSGDVENKKVIPSISDRSIGEIAAAEYNFIFGEGEERIGQYKPYFKPLSEIADTLNLKYEHCDLFQMRLRKSRVVSKELYKDNLLKEKHLKHLEVFKKIFNHVNPKIVITTSVITAKILKEILNLKLDEGTGLYIDNKGTYFYLNGSMSYGRLTEYDKERMILQIKKII